MLCSAAVLLVTPLNTFVIGLNNPTDCAARTRKILAVGLPAPSLVTLAWARPAPAGRLEPNTAAVGAAPNPPALSSN